MSEIIDPERDTTEFASFGPKPEKRQLHLALTASYEDYTVTRTATSEPTIYRASVMTPVKVSYNRAEPWERRHEADIMDLALLFIDFLLHRNNVRQWIIGNRNTW